MKPEGLTRDLFIFVRKPDLHESESAPGLFLRRADAQQQLIASGQTLSHGAQSAQKTRQPFAPHRILFGLPPAAFRQNIEFALVLIQLHVNRVAHFLPRQVEPFLLMLTDASFGRAHQIERLPLRLAHFLQNRFGWNAPIHYPYPARFAVSGLDLRQKIAQRGTVRRVAVQYFVGQRKTVGRNNQRDHQLQTIGSAVPAVAATGFGILFHLTLEISAGQIVEQNFEIGAEQVRPLLLQVNEQFLLMFEHAVQAAIQAVLLRHLKSAGFQQLVHSGIHEPLPMHTELAARIEQPICHSPAAAALSPNSPPSRPAGQSLLPEPSSRPSCCQSSAGQPATAEDA